MGITVGLDLGTTNSGVAFLEGRNPRMILNDSGGNTTPSAVWEDPSGELKVGSVAYRKTGAARRFKRMMGSDQALPVGGHNLAPEEVSSLILRALIQDAEKTLRKPVDSAVITVPANWMDGPRRATEAAGRLAGLNVDRLINEPTAAAMAYGMRDDAEGKTIAVYDLGGGTFDVTLLRINQKVFDVVTSDGDPHLGGIDFDLRLMDLAITRVQSNTGYRLPPEGSRDPKMAQRIRDLEFRCEEVKKELSFTTEAVLDLPFLDIFNGEPLNLEETIKRADLEDLIKEDIERTLQYMEKALRDAKTPREAIDEIVLVGGSTRIPLVRQRVAEFFGKEPLTSAVNPDEAIALGAALQAGIINQDEVSEDSYVALDIVNNTLGVEIVQTVGGGIVDGVFSPIIEKGKKVPTSNTESYSTAHDGQESVLIRCFEGGSAMTTGNTLLGEILVDGLPPRPRGDLKVDVTLTKTVSDMLEVGWMVDGTEIRGSHTIEMRSGLHSQEELDRRKGVLDSAWSGGPASPGNEETPAKVAPDWRDSAIAGKFRVLLDRVDVVLTEKGDFESRQSIESCAANLKDAILAGDEGGAEDLDLQLTDMLFDLE